MRRKKERGEYTGGRPPSGYRVEGGLLVEDPLEASMQQAARAMRSEGLSLRQIGECLTFGGLLPRSGGRWHAKTVRDLLR